MKAFACTYGPYMTRVMATLAGMVTLSLFLYGIFLLEAVAHTASRTETERQIALHTSELSRLEAQYLASTKEVTRERAASMGLTEPTRITTTYSGAQNALSLLSR